MNNNYSSSQPQLGATFYPGGQDDFYIPELISPAPQRYSKIKAIPMFDEAFLMPGADFSPESCQKFPKTCNTI
jgi:hypothetical protein